MNNILCARGIRAAATRWLKTASEPDVRCDVDFANCYRSDAKDLREVSTLVRRGKVKEAALAAEQLDTLVRELIPDDCWDYLQASL